MQLGRGASPVAEVRGVLRGEWHNDAREELSALPVRGQLV